MLYWDISAVFRAHSKVEIISSVKRTEDYWKITSRRVLQSRTEA